MGVNIGQAAKASGLSERMIRYFEKQGLIPMPARQGSGYRSYGDADVKRMRTIALAQDVGFPVPVIGQLIAMMDEAQAEQGDIGAQDEALAELERKTEALAELRGRIGAMVDKARSRLPLLDDDPDIDWGPPPSGPAEQPSGINILTVDREVGRSRRCQELTGSVERERVLNPAD